MPRIPSTHFVCYECGKSFCRKDVLTRHTRTIHKANAERHTCIFPGCSYSSLQKNNVKVHYNSKHLGQTRRCSLDGCSKSYLEMSSLIRHEKRAHGFYRKEQKVQAKGSADEFDVNGFFIKSEYEMEMPASTSQLCTLSAVATPSSIYFPLTPSDTSSSSPMSYASPVCYEPSSDDELLSEMIPELFSTPRMSPTLSNLGNGSPFQSPAYGYQSGPQIPQSVPAFDYNLQFCHL